MGRRAAIEEVGWMPECCLVGGEETEWHFRLRNAGWRILFSSDVEVVHLGGQTVSGNPYLSLEYIKGHLNIHRLHGGRMAFEGVRAAAMLGVASGMAFPGAAGVRSYALGQLRRYTFSSPLWQRPAEAWWQKRDSG